MSELFDKKDYQPRIIDSLIDEYLNSCGSICIEGPKWCGKTWTSAYHSASEFFVGNPDNNFSNRELAKMNPGLILKGETPRMIDEWQEVPAIWDAVRAEVDRRNEFGIIILTGSSTPNTKGILHSGAGRIACIRMNTMTLYESGDSDGKISLNDLVNEKFEDTLTGDVSLEKLAHLIIRGGWPKNIAAKNSAIMPKSYFESILDGSLMENEEKFSSDKMRHILKSLARNETTTVSSSRIAKDIQDIDGTVISHDTVSRYMEILERMFMLNNQEPFDPNFRSSLRVKGAVKHHFCDPALACAILDLNEKKLLSDMNTFGFMFEAMAERDLSVYAQSIGAKLYHYQNYSNEEIDAVIELDDGNWCAFEIKLGANRVDEAAINLNNVCDHIVSTGGKAPKIKCVICGILNAAYRRPDGVYVIPLTSLKN